ncbi:MAG: DegV family protein [Anaerolineaceae bacterium]
MKKVAIVTDSTASLSEQTLKGYPVFVLPLQIIWGEKILLDSVDITPTEFYQRLKVDKANPSTSQVTPKAFIDLYTRLLDEGYDILNILISSRLSGTQDSAVQAKSNFPGACIEIVDTQMTAMALGFQVMNVARSAAMGATMDECKAILEASIPNVGAVFTVSTLEYLHRGGRLSGASAFLGTALSLRPVLELKDGKIEAIERVRTTSKAVDRLLDLLVERVGNRTPIRIAGLHANAPEEVLVMTERARNRFNVSDLSEVIVSEISPVLGTHTGPGTLGLAFMAGK